MRYKHSLHSILAPRYNVYFLDHGFHSFYLQSFDTLEAAKNFAQDYQLKNNCRYLITKEKVL